MACSSRSITHRHADPFVMQEASDRLHVPFYFMAALQVFAMTHWMGRTVLRQHGCFSVNREGQRHAGLSPPSASWKPLSCSQIFPEGEVLHLNDRVMPFRRGRHGGSSRGSPHWRPGARLPTAIKYRYADDLGRRFTCWSVASSTAWGCKPSASCRWPCCIVRTTEALIEAGQRRCLPERQAGSNVERRERLIAAQLARFDRATTRPQVSRRFRTWRLRRQAIATLEESPGRSTREAAQRDLDELFAVMQLFSVAGRLPRRQSQSGASRRKRWTSWKRTSSKCRDGPSAAFDERSSPSASPSWPSPTAIANRRPSSWTDALESRVQELLDPAAHRAAALSEQAAAAPEALSAGLWEGWNAAPAAA